jgi:UTP--glucose-1-phosphate uridylyltransferase
MEFEALKASFFYTRQRLQRGSGDAILCAENFAGEKPFLVALGDSILGLNAVSQAVSRMADVFDSKRASCVIAVEEVPREETSHYGIVQPDKRNEIQLTDAIQFMCEEGRRVLTVKLTPEEKRYTFSNFPSYFESFVEFALADPLYGADFRLALERLVAKTSVKVGAQNSSSKV